MTAPSALKLPDLRGRTLLVVDDNDDAVEMLSTFFKACGADVLMARSASGGLAYIRQHPSTERRAVPVIALTGFSEDYLTTQQFDGFLRKPADLDALCGVLVSLISGHGA